MSFLGGIYGSYGDPLAQQNSQPSLEQQLGMQQSASALQNAFQNQPGTIIPYRTSPPIYTPPARRCPYCACHVEPVKDCPHCGAPA